MNLKEKALEYVNKSEIPVSIQQVSKEIEVTWPTTRVILLTLALEGKISAQKTGKSWIFSKEE